MTTMRAAITSGRGEPFTVRDVDIAEPGHGEVLVDIVATGLCHTDLAVRDGHFALDFPGVLGHEGSGVVSAVGLGVLSLEEGDHVVLTFPSCGQCPACHSARSAYCREAISMIRGKDRSGGRSLLSVDGEALGSSFFGQSSFATRALATEANAIRVPKEIPLELLGPLGCGVQTGAGAVLNALRVSPGSSVVVFGMGSVGCSALMAAVLAGATTIIAIDTQQERLTLANELGATHIVPAGEPATSAVLDITGGGADFAIEAAGSPAVVEQAFSTLHRTGVCAVLGVGDGPLNIGMREVMLGRTLRGVIEGDSVPHIFIPTLAELYQQGRFPIDRLITRYALDDINQAAADAEAGKVIKPLLMMT